jgi:hypothetical protein
MRVDASGPASPPPGRHRHRAGTDGCCYEANRASAAQAATHWRLFHATSPAHVWLDPGLLCLFMDLGSGDEDKDSHVRWLVRVDGHIATAQPGPYGEWWDGYLVDVTPGAPPRTVELRGEYRPRTPPLVQTFIAYQEDGRLHLIEQKRADPLFQDTEFDWRWPLPDLSKPLLALTASEDSAGWRDLGELHELTAVEHRYALQPQESGTTRRLIYYLGEAAKDPGKWAGVLIARGGGNRRTEQELGKVWQAPLDDPDLLEAVATVQAAGLPVLVGVGHEWDTTGVERLADFAWPTPSTAGSALARLARYQREAQNAPQDGLPIGVYNLGRVARQEFDDAWARWHGEENRPRPQWGAASKS